jgi:hypothetical protein
VDRPVQRGRAQPGDTEFIRTTQLPRDRELFDDRDAKFHFVSTFARSEILVRVRNSVYVYDLDADRVSRYTPGDPVTIVVANPRELRGDQVNGSAEHHVGLHFDIVIRGSGGAELKTPGVAILEEVRKVTATGWFANAPSVEQTSPSAWSADHHMVDLLSISTLTPPVPTPPSPGMAAAASPPHSSSPPAATTASGGEFVGFQRFMYVADDGALRPIPSSGFLITKRVEGGRLTVTRAPQADDRVAAGIGQATATIEFA